MAINAKFLLVHPKHKSCLPQLGNGVNQVKFNNFNPLVRNSDLSYFKRFLIFQILSIFNLNIVIISIIWRKEMKKSRNQLIYS